MVVNLKNYKLARKFKDDSAAILKVIDLSLRALEIYKTYRPVQLILTELRANRTVLEAHLRTAEKILAEGKQK